MFCYYDIHTHQNPTNQDVKAIFSVDTKNPVIPKYGYCSVGIHPRFPGIVGLPELETMAKHPNVVAIGETGFDKLASTSLDLQQEVFIAHIELAEKIQKPLIIHCVKAWPKLIHIHKRFKSAVPRIIHGFRGNGELARQLLQLGFHLSFSIHFHPKALHEAWNSHRLYAETDDANINISDIYQHITSQLSITNEALSREISENIKTWPIPPNGMIDY